MSKKKYLVFNNNRLPRLLTNPSEEVLSSLDPKQVLLQPSSLLNAPLEDLVLDKGVIRNITLEEKEDIKHLLNTRRIIPTQTEVVIIKEYEKRKKTRVLAVCNIITHIGTLSYIAYSLGAIPLIEKYIDLFRSYIK